MVETSYARRNTREVIVGGIGIGGDNPVRVQSMITEKTSDVNTAAQQIIALHQAGAEIVRVTVPTMKDARHLGEIRHELNTIYQHVPLVADVHHAGSAIAVAATEHADKVRINPGLFVHHKKTGKVDYTQHEIDEQVDEIETALTPLVDACKERGVAMRIGVNHGSLAERLTVMYGDTPEGMVQSSLEYIKICESLGFYDLVVSLKASRVPLMIESYRLMAQRMEEQGMDYPLHLGVTEAGMDDYARIKSAIGIGTLLSEGIGDTIRVSLTENPVNEIPAAYDILQATGLRRTKAEFIACPGCGRTQFDLPSVAKRVEGATKHLDTLSVAVMGCIVNGPGEMGDADFGYVGMGAGKVGLYKGKELLKLVPQKEALDTLIQTIKEEGQWVDPPGGEIEMDEQELKPRLSFE